jgi:transcriptional regulator with XRE-family HTH domain
LDKIVLKHYCLMQFLGDILKHAREAKNLILRKVAAEVDIDQSLISKFEKNERKPTKEQITRLAIFYDLSEKDLLINWYSERIAEDLKYSDSTTEILKVAEEKIKYLKTQDNGK